MECYDVLNSYILAPWFYYSSNSLAKCVHVLCSQICFMLQVLNNGIEQQTRLFANNQMYSQKYINKLLVQLEIKDD